MDIALARVIASTVTIEEKALLRGFLTKPEVVQIINLDPQPSELELRGILKAYYQSLPLSLVENTRYYECICISEATKGDSEALLRL